MCMHRLSPYTTHTISQTRSGVHLRGTNLEKRSRRPVFLRKEDPHPHAQDERKHSDTVEPSLRPQLPLTVHTFKNDANEGEC